MKRLLLFIFMLSLTSCAVPTTPLPNSPATSTLFPTLVSPTQTPTPNPTLLPTNPPTNSPPIRPTGEPTLPTAPPTVQLPDPVLVGAGDIAMCESKGDEVTAALVEKIEGTVFTLGDSVYPNGTEQEFQNCYESSWGKFKARTRPVPGNHDYNSPNAKPYFGYFGASAGDPARGYYAYDLGAWHILALNSEIDTGANSVQVKWIRADLDAHPTQCTLAMFHRPLFSSGPHGRDGTGEKTRPLWDVLYEKHVDVILNGHDHDYERFAPQDPQGNADPANGIRQFVVGTGGAVPYVFGNIKPNSEKHFTGAFGVLKLTLHPGGYDWEFISAVPLLFSDQGSDQCH